MIYNKLPNNINKNMKRFNHEFSRYQIHLGNICQKALLHHVEFAKQSLQHIYYQVKLSNELILMGYLTAYSQIHCNTGIGTRKHLLIE